MEAEPDVAFKAKFPEARVMNTAGTPCTIVPVKTVQIFTDILPKAGTSMNLLPTLGRLEG